MTAHPYDIASLASHPFDREVAWPLELGWTLRFNERLQDMLCALIREEAEAPSGEVLAIGLPPILVTLLTVGTATATAQAAETREIKFAYGNESIAASVGQADSDTAGFVYRLANDRFEAAVNGGDLLWARRLAHGLVTNRGPGRIGAPEVVVLGQNKLLRDVARADRTARFRYEGADRMFRAGAAVEIDGALETRLTECAGAITDRFAGCVGEAVRAPTALIENLRRMTADWLVAVARRRAALIQNWHRVPDELWTGTGGNHVHRLAAAAVRGNGGRVTRFEHGGGGHIHRRLGALEINEFLMADRFVTETEAKAQIYRTGTADFRLAGRPPQFLARPDGGQSFRWLNGAAGGDIRRVMYVTTAFVGELQFPLQPLLPDVVYADWQGRLLDGLAARGFEMLCKQHPEHHVRRGNLVLSRQARYLDGMFAETLDAADAFVFDYPATTALWEAICTRKPVLFVDFGLADWAPEVWSRFKDRCAVLPATFDERNRPLIDFAEAEEKLRAAPMDDAFATAYLTGRAR